MNCVLYHLLLISKFARIFQSLGLITKNNLNGTLEVIKLIFLDVVLKFIQN